MKKKTITLALALMLTIPMNGFAINEVAQDAFQQNVLQTSAMAFAPGSVPAESSAIDAIIPAVNAVAITMATEDMAYDTNDSTFVWSTLYNMINYYAHMDQRAVVGADYITFEAVGVQDFAGAMFGGNGILPAVPATMADRVKFDVDTNSYQIAISEMAKPQIIVIEQGNALTGTVLMADGTVEQFSMALERNHSMFGYAVVAATMN